MAGSVNELVSQDPSIYPFSEARVEGFGTGVSKRKRKDLRFVNGEGRLVLCGEVKLPGTPAGHCQRKVRRAEFSTEDRKLGRRDLTPLGDCSCAFDLEMVP